MKPKTAFLIGLGMLIVAALLWPVHITAQPAKRHAHGICVSVNSVAKPFIGPNWKAHLRHSEAYPGKPD